MGRIREILKRRKHDVALLWMTSYSFLAGVSPFACRTVDSYPQQEAASSDLTHCVAQSFLLNKRLRKNTELEETQDVKTYYGKVKMN